GGGGTGAVERSPEVHPRDAGVVLFGRPLPWCVAVPRAARRERARARSPSPRPPPRPRTGGRRCPAAARSRPHGRVPASAAVASPEPYEGQDHRRGRTEPSP